MAIMTDMPKAVDTSSPSHAYHAEAHVLSGDLQRPIEQRIEQHAPVALKDRRGGHLTRLAEQVSIEGLISFTKGKTRVSGSRSLKHNGWLTLSTSILEGLNVFEVVTADRIVSQISTDHPYKDGHFPHVSFLGTQFNNLRIGGFAPVLTLNLGICGGKPAGDKSYFRDANFLRSLKDQTEEFAKAKGLPKDFKDQYDEKLTYIKKLISAVDSGDQTVHQPITCSLVQSIGEIPIPGIQIVGNVLLIPEFGTVTLGEVEVSEKKFEGSERPCIEFALTSVKMKMGCLAAGTAAVGTVRTNGQSYP